MRISDWSSDVCSSDLLAIDALFYGHDVVAEVALDEAFRPCADLQRLELLLGNRLAGNVGDDRGVLGLGPEHPLAGGDLFALFVLLRLLLQWRLEVRRVGIESVSQCSTRWSPYH